MNPEERHTMILLGKALQAHLDEHKAEKGEPMAIVSPLQPSPPTLSVASRESVSERFKMEIRFDPQHWAAADKEQQVYRLFTKMEEMLMQHGVVSMHGDYNRYGH